MKNESIKDINDRKPEKTYELLSLADKGESVTVRDDQYDFSCLLDSVKLCRRRNGRFRLIDSGKLDFFQLEWLGRAGADIYTSDKARSDVSGLELVNRACKGGDAFASYFFHGPLESEEGANSISFPELQKIGINGIYLHLTNRENKRELSQLNDLAYACRKGGSWLVYYHHGVLESSFEELGKNDAWIHVTDDSLKESEDGTQVLDKVKSLLSSGAKLVIHMEKGLDFLLLRDIMKTGAFVLFKSSLYDYKSPFRVLERESRKRIVDFRAYYLYLSLLP
jgi:hypothetical protein